MEFEGELLDAFIVSCQEQLGDIERHVLALEDKAGQAESDHVGAIFRAAHSIKADAAAMGFDRISAFAHAVEDVLDLVRGGRLEISRQLIDALLGAFDCLRGMVTAPGLSAALDFSPNLMQLGRVLSAALQARPGAEARACVDAEPEPLLPAAKDTPEADTRIMQLTIPAAKLDGLVDQVGELAALQARLAHCARADRAVAAVTEDMARFLDGLREQVMSLRLVPLKPVFAKFRRLVRDVAARTGKQVEFHVFGEETTLDKSAVERVQGPLAHIVRNAVDHGIEPALTRMAAGKDPDGRVWMSARQIGGEVEIVIRDDGGGIDRDRLADRARAHGLLPAGLADQACQLTDLVCLPGLSTAERVSSDSGRGVGMDAAREAILDMRGSLELVSEPGQGTTARIRVPLSLAMLDCLEVRVGEATFFIPLPCVEECLELRRDQTTLRAGRGVLQARGQALPVIELATFFEFPANEFSVAPVVAVHAGEDRLGLIVDGIVGHRQIVLKSLGRAMGRLDGVQGCTVREDGQMALVLDIPAILRVCLREAGGTGHRDPS